MKKLLLLLLIALPVLAFCGKLNITLSKNSLSLDAKDSIVYKFYLPSGAHTSIKFINIYGGEEIVFEENNPRTKGWHEVVLHSDSLKKYFGELSSGLYYLNFSAENNGNNILSFNSFQTPWGESVTAENMTLDKATGEITFDLPKFSMARTRIGMKSGCLFHTFNWQPLIPGPINLIWDKSEYRYARQVFNVINPDIQVEAFGLPATIFYLTNSSNPINTSVKLCFPDNWQQFALSPKAKIPIDTSIDPPLDFEINLQGRDAFSIAIAENTKNTDNLKRIMSPENEIYVSVNGEFYVEKVNIEVFTPLTIAIPELAPGTHTFIVNLIFNGGNMAIGMKEVTVQ